MLVVHGTPLVAEDLRETLLSAGATEVELALVLPDTPPPVRYDMCFLSVPSDAIFDHGLLDRAGRVASHVVLVTGFLHAASDLPPHVSILSEPFRQEDVLAAMLASRGEDGTLASPCGGVAGGPPRSGPSGGGGRRSARR
ncbi:MAG: hypothetical protein ACOCYW_00505 [Roseicyclus sp.]